MTVVRNVMVGLHNRPEYKCSVIESILRLPRHFKMEKAMRAKAKELLYSTNMNIAEISSKLNFECIGQFSTFFKKKVGVPPLEFRKRGTKNL